MGITSNFRSLLLAVFALLVIGTVLFGPFSESFFQALQSAMSLLFNYGYENAAINSAKATTFATSCTAMINMHGGSPAQPVQDAWENPLTDTIEKSCQGATSGNGVEFKEEEDDTGVKVTCPGLDETGEGCEIYRFALPQEKPRGGWIDYVVGLGHPRYLLYYESFPHGPSNAWERIDENLGAMAIAIGGFTNVLFFGAGKLASKGISRYGGKTLGRLKPHQILRSGDEVAEVSRFQRIKNFMANKVGRGADEAAIRSVDDAARTATGSVMARTLPSNALETMDGPTTREFLERLRIFRKSNELTERSVSQISDDIAEFAPRYLPDSVSDDAVDEMSLDIALMYRGADEVDAGINTGFSSAREYWEWTATSSSIADDVIKADDVVGKVDDLAGKGDDTMSAFSRVDPPRGLSKSNVWQKVKFIACRSRVWRYALITNADNVFPNNEELELAAQLAGVGATSTGNLCGNYNMPTSFTQQMSSMGTATKVGIGGAAAVTAYMAKKAESKSEMYEPNGINSIVLKAPFTEPKVYRMHPYANYYYMSVAREDFGQHNKRRFYYVAPFTTRNLDSDNPHLYIDYEPGLECKKMSDSEARHKIRTQADWNDGETDFELLPDGWKNNVWVRSPSDPNTDNVPGGGGPDVISAAGNGIKTCQDPGLLDDISSYAPWVDNRFQVRALTMRHENMRWQTSDGNPNYGYDSGDWDEKVLKFTVLAGVLVVDIIIEGASLGLATPIALAFTGASYTFINHEIESGSYWPEH